MSRSPSNAAKVRDFMRFVGRAAKGPGRIYLTGGASAVLIGWRRTTVDVDVKLDPEPPGVFEAIARAKEALDLNVELAAPDDFVPALPGWRTRSLLIGRRGPVAFLHYDFHGQALAKIERGHVQDLEDVEAMRRLQLIEVQRLADLFEAVKPGLARYPAIDAASFSDRVCEALRDLEARNP